MDELSVENLVAVFKDLPVEFAPGERFAYNNSGYVLLGAIIESVSGMSYEVVAESMTLYANEVIPELRSWGP